MNYTGYINEHYIWLGKEKTIEKAHLYISNEAAYLKALEELKDINYYVGNFEGLHREDIRIKSTPRKANIYIKEGYHEILLDSLENSRKYTACLLNHDFSDDFDLLNLFSTPLQGDSETLHQEIFEYANLVLKALETSNMSPSEKKEAIKQLWPDFGYFATEVLNCVTFKTSESYNLEELKEMQTKFRNMKINPSESIEHTLANEALSQRNEKVLTLANFANFISKS